MPRSDDRVAALAERYSAEAEGYLAVYSPHLLPFQRELLALVDLTRAARILDLGSGPGTAIPFIRAASPSSLVVAADRAIGMIALAPGDSPRVALDAMDLPFADGSFDAVLMAFMAFHLPDPRAGFAEAERVLAAGGSLAIATWGTEETIGDAWVEWDEELDRAGAPSTAPIGLPDYRSLGSAEALTTLLRTAGFADIGFQMDRWTYRPSHEDFMAFMREHVVRDRLVALDPARRAACIEAVTERTRGLPASDLGLDAEVLFAVATR